jgi:cytochrome c-type biogenesis protein CcmE
MHKKTKNRLIFWCLAVFSLFAGITIILFNLSENLSFFITPTILLEKNVKFEVKLGGYAKNGSVKKIDLDEIEFALTDRVNEVKVRFKGAVPIIFREGQGVIVTGKMENNIFVATQLFAKHDEKYMPKKISRKIKDKK